MKSVLYYLPLLLTLSFPLQADSLSFFEESPVLQVQGSFSQVPSVDSGRKIRSSHALSVAGLKDTFSFEVDNETFQLSIYKIAENPDGTRTVFAKTEGTDSHSVITSGKVGVIAEINTSSGQYKVELRQGQEWLLTPADLSQHQAVKFGNDAVTPSADRVQSLLQQIPPSDPAPQQEGISSTIDIMVLYTPELATDLGGESAAVTQINQLIALSNQAYIDSEMMIELRLVHTQQLAVTNSDNDNVLDALTDGESSATLGDFSQVSSIRETHGADLVLLLRNFVPQHAYCGVAWVLGDQTTGSMPIAYRRLGYSVVNVGSYEVSPGRTAFCSDYTFAHELGHNFGFDHDRGHDSNNGLFPYSYGHDSPGSFATIMSYDSPEVGKFSNPNISCASGQSCGILGSADNAQSGNNVRNSLAAFYPTANNTIAGDANGDGTVNIQDVILMLNIVLGNTPDAGTADCNGDSTVNIQDVICGLNIVLGNPAP